MIVRKGSRSLVEPSSPKEPSYPSEMAFVEAVGGPFEALPSPFPRRSSAAMQYNRST